MRDIINNVMKESVSFIFNSPSGFYLNNAMQSLLNLFGLFSFKLETFSSDYYKYGVYI